MAGWGERWELGREEGLLLLLFFFLFFGRLAFLTF
jgi:hypothetical protein